MYLPKLIPYDVKKVTISSFKGMNKGKVTEENEFYDIMDLWGKQYPMLSSMPVRYRLDSIDTGKKAIGVFENRGIGIVCSNVFGSFIKYENEEIKLGFDEELSSANILNFNTKTLLIKGKGAYEFDPYTKSADIMGYTLKVDAAHDEPESVEATLRLSVVYEDNTPIGKFTLSTEDAEFPQDAALNDCFAKNLTYYRLIYKNTTIPENSIWQVQTSVRLRMEIAEGFRMFKTGDYVRLKGLKYWNWAIRSFDALDRFIRIEHIDSEGRYITEPVEIFEDMSIIMSERKYPSNDIVGYDHPIVDNAGNDLYMLEGEISSCMPELDFICANSNRVWACSNKNREIYSSEQGNARNWSVFEGLASDSYTVSVASPGDFTAAVNYLDTPVFFKENEMMIITGSRPSNYHVTAYNCRGVPKDSPMGVCVLNDTLYYKSHDGIYAYSGSRPECISKELDGEMTKLCHTIMYSEGDLLLVSGKKDEESCHYVYDTKKKLWYSYSSPETVGCLKYPDATLELCKRDSFTEIYTLFSGIPKDCGYKEGESVEKSWCFESGNIFYNTPDRKYISRIKLDTECSDSSQLLISYDGSSFEKVCDIPAHTRGKREIMLFPKPCGHFRIRVEGKGCFGLYTLTKEVEEVSEDG